MILIVDSGSTKSDWVLLDDEAGQTFFCTMGLNPYFHSEEVVYNAVVENEFSCAVVNVTISALSIALICKESNTDNWLVVNALI